jgi:asparagine synthase (glutamine-hydrolysing)
MCGIAGVVGREPGSPALARRVALMHQSLAHRGPDGGNLWTSPAGHATFANTRLAIVDTSPHGAQPLSIDDGRLTITFNGEIYNFMELRRDLASRGAVFRTRSDAEVILRAYDAYGARCVDRLRGMFAFAIWDDRTRCLTLARDRFGIKPLYYSLQHDQIVFASEVRALRASGLIAPAIDSRAAYEFFRTGSVPEPRTLLASVKCVEASHLVSWRPGRLVERRYWEPRFDASIAATDAPAELRGALGNSVEHHLISDVPAGFFLSGGVDSTALLALAHAGGHRRLRAVTMALPGAPADELSLARRTAEHFGAEHVTCAIDAASARALLPEYFGAMDQPSIDGLNTLVVSRAARASGLKVMLSGIGADELFGGYQTLRAVPRMYRWHRLAAATGPLARAIGATLENAGDHRWRRVGDLLRQAPSLDHAYRTYRGIFTRAEARKLTTQFLGEAPAADAIASTIDASLEDATSWLELTRYMANQLLRDADTMGMSQGVEIRVPYIDARVVDTAFSIEHRHRLRAGKALLRAAVPEIPAWIASQPKRGFMFPIEDWLRGEWHGVFEDIEQSTDVAMGPWYRKWCVKAFAEFLQRAPQTTPVTPPRPAVTVQ